MGALWQDFLKIKFPLQNGGILACSLLKKKFPLGAVHKLRNDSRTGSG